MTHAAVFRIGMGVVCLFLACGCGAGGKRAAVSGKVTLDGELLETGSITFQPIEGTESPSAGAAITRGAYDIPRTKGPTAGVFRVEIRAKRKTGKQIPAGSPAPPGTMVDEVVEVVPARYNKESTLRAEVKPGTNPLTFELTSK
jgi:hypothetical protein